MSADPADPLSRIHRLERQVHRARAVALVCGATAGVALVSGSGRTPPAVQAQRFELLDGAGRRAVILGTDSTGFVVTLLGPQGRPAAFLRLSTEPRVTLETGRGREVAGLGSPRVQHLED